MVSGSTSSAVLHDEASLGAGVIRHSGVPGNTPSLASFFWFYPESNCAQASFQSRALRVDNCALHFVRTTATLAQSQWNPTPPSPGAQSAQPTLNAATGGNPFQNPVAAPAKVDPPTSDPSMFFSGSIMPASSSDGQMQELTSTAPKIATAPDNPTQPVAEADASKSKSAEEIAESVGEELAETAEHASSTVLAALQGDVNAQQAMIDTYFWPALKFMLVLMAANWLGIWFGRLAKTTVTHRVDATLGHFSGNVVRCVVMFLVFSIFFGSYLSAVGTLIAAVGFAIAMAFQGTLGNFASGIALLVFRPFNVGDFIKVDGDEGTVSSIELFTTRINTLDNRHIIIPNNSVFGSKIENWTHNRTRRVEVAVGVAYSADMQETRRILFSALENIEGADHSRHPEVYLCELNSSSVDWSCRLWCSPEDYLAVRERVTESVKTSLDRHNISIPFPQMDLHVVTPARQKKMAA